MTTFFLTLLVTALAMAALSLGLFLGRHPIKGSCGGLGGCEACGGDRSRCPHSDSGNTHPEAPDPFIEKTSSK